MSILFDARELSCRLFQANAVRLQLHALAYNLGNFLRTLATPEPIQQGGRGRSGTDAIDPERRFRFRGLDSRRPHYLNSLGWARRVSFRRTDRLRSESNFDNVPHRKHDVRNNGYPKSVRSEEWNRSESADDCNHCDDKRDYKEPQ